MNEPERPAPRTPGTGGQIISIPEIGLSGHIPDTGAHVQLRRAAEPACNPSHYEATLARRAPPVHHGRTRQ